jgi:hypothetical protein
VTAVTGVIAMSAVIAGIVLLGPVRAAPHGGQGSRASRDLRAGRDRRDPSRLSRPHCEVENFLCACPLRDRCNCKCEAKIAIHPTMTILYFSKPHTAQDHACELDKGIFLKFACAKSRGLRL